MYNGFYIMINYNLHTNRDKQGLGHRVYLAGDLHSKVSVRAGGREEGREEGGEGGAPCGPSVSTQQQVSTGLQQPVSTGSKYILGLANGPTLIPVPCE